MEYRNEHDLLGELRVPFGVYWGIHTQRAISNFGIPGPNVNPRLITALAMVKKACCMANAEAGYIDSAKAAALVRACDEVIAGKWMEQFPLAAIQGGAGTSTNMNVNEVLANRAAEIMGGGLGEYKLVHPLDDVNLHQSTNDVYPTAVKIAAILSLRGAADAAAGLQGVFQRKEKEFAGIVKIGRTEMQEAVPITLGAEFGAFAEAFGRDRWRMFKCEERLRQVNIGGTAVGTGLTAPRKYIFSVIEKLREISGIGLARGENVLDQTANADCFTEVSGMLKAHAVNLVKISNDIRLMNLLGEIRVPPVQAGSSIMPGKVNPVMWEAAVQAGMRIIANDGVITGACASASLQINEWMPLLANALLESLDLISGWGAKIAEHAAGITACQDVCAAFADTSPGIVTAFLPYIGYGKAQDLLAEYRASGGKSVRGFLSDRLGAELVDKVLSPYSLTALGFVDKK